jgi:leader peptidase (prepilin peptidase) / N-methyltransferase
LGEKVFKKEALGFGDVWLLAGLGAWMGPGALLPIVLLASVQGSVVGLALVALGRSQPGPDASTPPATSTGTSTDDDWVPPRHAVPFGPFLVAGALEWLWLGHLLARAVPMLELFR